MSNLSNISNTQMFGFGNQLYDNYFDDLTSLETKDVIDLTLEKAIDCLIDKSNPLNIQKKELLKKHITELLEKADLNTTSKILSDYNNEIVSHLVYPIHTQKLLATTGTLENQVEELQNNFKTTLQETEETASIMVKEITDSNSLLVKKNEVFEKTIDQIRTRIELMSLKANAFGGDPDAIHTLGLCYKVGIEVVKDQTRAFHLFREAAELGHLEAQYQLAICYLDGIGTKEDDYKAFQLFEKVAQKGYAMGEWCLGLSYLYGLGIIKDLDNALLWLFKAANKGEAKAQHQIGMCYLLGRGIGIDYKKVTDENLDKAVYTNSKDASEWFYKAAEQGYDKAQFSLALLCECGDGMAVDLDKALEWYSKAAKQGHSKAEEALARLGQDPRKKEEESSNPNLTSDISDWIKI